MSSEFAMSREDMDRYLNELAKELRKSEGKNAHFEIIVVGGAAIIQNYTFRQMSTDIDAMMNDRAIREAARRVADKFGIPLGWINSDFERTISYTPALRGFSKYYKTFCHILEVRAIEREYLIAMKLMSGRLYKNDLSDIVGVLSESAKNGDEISKESIDAAMHALYGGWEQVDPLVEKVFSDIMEKYESHDDLYASIKHDEKTAKHTLAWIDGKYKGIVKEDTITDILKNNRKTKNQMKILKDKDTEKSFIDALDKMFEDL